MGIKCCKPNDETLLQDSSVKIQLRNKSLSPQRRKKDSTGLADLRLLNQNKELSFAEKDPQAVVAQNIHDLKELMRLNRRIQAGEKLSSQDNLYYENLISNLHLALQLLKFEGREVADESSRVQGMYSGQLQAEGPNE